MAITNRDLLRLRLGDPAFDRAGEPIKPHFDDPALDALLSSVDDDVDGAAAEGWRQLRAYYANSALNIDLDNSSISREALYKHASEMVDYYEERSGEPHDFTNVELVSQYESAQGDDFVG